MKNKSIITFIILTLFSCKRMDDRVFGVWLTSSNYYKACYEINKNENGEIFGKVLSYDDGTMKYVFSEENPKYVFENLTKTGHEYVDGVSGATSTNLNNKNISIKIIHRDTLDVETYVSKGHISKEKWIRKTK